MAPKKTPPAPIPSDNQRNDPPTMPPDENEALQGAESLDAEAAIAAAKISQDPNVPRGTGNAEGLIEPNFQNTKKIRVDRFRLSLEKCLKNRSINERELNLVPVEHRHFWDSLNRQGKTNTHTEFMCGHKHKVEYQIDKEGNIIATSMKCGPALSEQVSMLPNQKRLVKLVPVDFGVDPNSQEGKHSLDDHFHKVEYMKSEHMTVKL